MVCNGISDLIHRKASWHALAEIPLAITLGDIYLSWSAQIKYLGCCFRGIQCAVDPSSFIGRFYGSFNNILNVIGNSLNEISALYLIQMYCIPSLLYSCETWYLSSCDVKRVEVAWNNPNSTVIWVPYGFYLSVAPIWVPDSSHFLQTTNCIIRQNVSKRSVT